MNVGKRLKEIRVSKGLTLMEVQNELGYFNLRRIEEGNFKSLKYYHLISISDFYKVSPMYLLGFDEKTYHIEPKWVVLIQKLKDKGLNPRDVIKCVEKEFEISLRNK
ncbi:transcriptional regulator with XRE-family HTH domain [Metabacillus crassostreae]|uniref:helix-turn-helix domain-containing protein n=1 Tax=Metabacillus crassostreae TaxID=929098 RepID=UPI00195AC876|nr:transcriptional regulator with XRE-family HTH domain [Metabacillus crassostreae]